MSSFALGKDFLDSVQWYTIMNANRTDDEQWTFCFRQKFSKVLFTFVH